MEKRLAGPLDRDQVAVFLVGVSGLLLQIALTRLLSVVIWYHHAFLVVSLAMLGASASGVWLALARDPGRFLGLLFFLASTAPLAAILLVKHGAAWMGRPWLLVATLLPSFVGQGGVVCLLLMRAPRGSLGRVYAASLLGAAAGALLAVPLLWRIPTPVLAAATGLLPLLALSLYPTRLRRVAWVLLPILLGLCFLEAPFRVTRSKSYDEGAVAPILESWSPFARLTVFDESFFYLKGHERGFLWGPGKAPRPGGSLRQFWLEQDGSAGSPIQDFEGDLSRMAFLEHDVTAVGYALRPPRRVAVVGPGGGRDVLSALVAGAETVDAIEVNPDVVRVVSEVLAGSGADPYQAAGVRTVVADGRSFFARHSEEYDLIQISLADTWAASLGGAYALAENTLYTVEAFRLYLDRLEPDGLLCVSRWTKETPWLLLLARSALQASGVEAPEKHLALVSSERLATLLVSPTPFAREDMNRLLDIAAERGFGILFPSIGGRRPPEPFVSEAAVRGLEGLVGTGAETRPATDDRPFFFHVASPFRATTALVKRLREITGLSVTLEPVLALRRTAIWVSALALFLVLVPPIAVRAQGPSPSGLVYFASIGAGFMLLEASSIPRFVLYLGHPTFATTVVLASLLLGLGLGSFASERIRGRPLVFLLTAPVAVALQQLVLPFFFERTLAWPLGARIVSSAILLVPAAALLGLFFPAGMAHFHERHRAWFWAVNGFAGVAAGVLSLALSMEAGFRAVGFLAALAYAMACAALVRSGGEGTSDRGKLCCGSKIARASMEKCADTFDP